MKILITGAAGNVGAHLTESLGSSHEIISLSRHGEDSSYQLDLAEQFDKVSEIFADERPDAVIHLAALLGRSCENDPELAERVNVDVTRHLAELAVTYATQRFLFLSTAAVYNQPEYSPTDEQSNIDPRSVYGQTKLRAEQAIDEVAAHAADTQFVTLRPFNIYGPNFRKSLVHLLTHSSPENPVGLWDLHNVYRDYIHVSDVAQAVTASLEHDFSEAHTIMNIGSGIARNNAQLVKELTENGIHPAYTSGEDGPLDVLWANIDRAAKEIDFNPSTSLIVDK